jgi:hypothetical protein
MMHDFAFYDTDMQARRLPWLVVPARRLLRRLLGPVWERERALFEALHEEHVQLGQRLIDVHSDLGAQVAYLSERIDEVERQVRATAALGWDHVALTRRLTAIEDRLYADQHGEAAPPEEKHLRT